MSFGNLIPSSLLKLAEHGYDYVVLVDKSAQKVFLYNRDDTSKPVKEYRCSTGENDGPKLKKNDRKTPEGVYFLSNVYKKKDLSPIYGAKAFAIDYPSPFDKKVGKRGYGIWLHGTNEPLEPRDSNGCIVFENDSIKDLDSYVTLYKTPVVISSGIKLLSPDKIQKESKELEALVEHWRGAWEKKDIDRYMSFYSALFSSEKMDWHRWKAYKDRLGKKYGEFEIEINNLQIFNVNDVVLAHFYQTYRTAGYESRGEKRLYLVKNNKEWKILGEFFEKDKSAKKAVDKKRKPPVQEEIRSFIHAWKKAWQEKNLTGYIASYDRDFSSHGMDLNQWKKYKAGLNDKYHSIKIKINRLKIIHDQDSPHRAKVRFRQRYQADDYHDLGIKKLLLVKKGKAWKIKNEGWLPITKK
ncbi:MAG: L,D-transpeptidase family protein [Desulfobacterales bacterium]|nr:L,D-transpeptidase family protein [Desulfobacterales bacterium]